MKHFVESNISKHFSSINIVKYVCTLLLVSPVLISCSTHRINRLEFKNDKKLKTFQWTEAKRSSDKEVAKWIIYSRQVEGTNFFEYKIEGEIGASPEACVSAFRRDIYKQRDNNKKYPTYNIVKDSKESILTYVIHNEPFPLKDTEMSVMYLFSNEEETDTAVKWHEAWDECSVQPSKKLNRVESFRGSWHFTTISKNQVKAVNTVQFDPKKVPMWLVKPMVMQFLRKGLQNLRAMTTNEYI